MQPGPTNSLLDVAGVRVGHHTARGDGWLTGTTVVLAPDGGAVAGVDVRGGGPGTRETDLLDPRNQVERVDAVTLCGGSAYGLAAADGVMRCLAEADRGFRVGPRAGEVVPIVPAAVVFDLGRGGSFARRPDAGSGAAAYAAAGGTGPVAQGVVGAGTGAVAGGLKGGVGTASAVLTDGTTVAALVVVNAVGSTVDPSTGELYGVRFGLPGEFAVTPPSAAEVTAARVPATGPASPVLATTIGVIATDAVLTKAQCAKVAGVGHDGLARAVRPVHSMLDGDTLFALATGAREAVVHDLLTAAADCVTRAVVHAMLAAATVTTPAGTWRSYADTFPSAVARGR
ncbi:MAG TPA: P1 family peptidase [Mycobacteriales bacterium]|nr:P1 family peptidase [Mycobacteriales bacterium]